MGKGQCRIPNGILCGSADLRLLHTAIATAERERERETRTKYKLLISSINSSSTAAQVGAEAGVEARQGESKLSFTQF